MKKVKLIKDFGSQKRDDIIEVTDFIFELLIKRKRAVQITEPLSSEIEKPKKTKKS